MAANAAMFSDNFIIFKKKWFKDFNGVFTKEFSRFYKLEYLVSKIVKASHEICDVSFISFIKYWNSLDNAKVSVIPNLVNSGAKSNHVCSLDESHKTEKSSIRSVIDKRIESFAVNKGHTIRSVLECLFWKVVLDHLVSDNELVLDSVKYLLLSHIDDNAFSKIMVPVGFNKLVCVVKNLPNGKTAELSGITNKIHFQSLFIEDVLTNTRPIALIEMAHKVLFKLLSNKIFLVCSKFGILYSDNFSVLKGIMTQFFIFAVGSVVENALEKNCELWLVLQDMQKAYDSLDSNQDIIYGNRINRIITDYGLTEGYCVHDGLDQGEVFSPLLWKIFYDPLLCELNDRKGGMTSFLAAGAFVDNTIWVGSSQVATQYILDIASSFFKVNDITINNEKTVAIPINQRIKDAFLSISGLPISIAHKEECHRYFGIFLSFESLSKFSLVKTYSDVRFFVNLVLKKAILNKQFLYLVLVILQPIVNALIRRGLRLKAGLLRDFFNEALYHPLLYDLKLFKQLQTECKMASLLSFSNNGGLVGHLFEHRVLDLQVLSWLPIYFLCHPVKLHASLVNNFLAGVIKILISCNMSFDNFFLSAFHFLGGTSMSFFSISVVLPVAGSQFLDAYVSDVVFKIRQCLFVTDLGVINVYTDGFLRNLDMQNMKCGVAAYFSDLDLSISIGVDGLVSSMLAEIQAIILALECILFGSSVIVYSDIQAALDIEWHGAMAAIRNKELKVSWYKVKRHLGILGNKHANELAGLAAGSNCVLSVLIKDKFVRTGEVAMFVNICCFTHKIFGAVYQACWEVEPGSKIIDASMIRDVDWVCTTLVWHPDSHMAAGFTSRFTANLCSYFIKTLYHYLLVAVRKHIYNSRYPSVLCFHYKDIEGSNYFFICLFDAKICGNLLKSYLAQWDTQSGFLFKDWYLEALFIFDGAKITGENVVKFVRDLGVAHCANVWLVHAKFRSFMEKRGLIMCDESLLPDVYSLLFLLSIKVVRLLGVAKALSGIWALLVK
ncbi:hypothetical protein G9A89_006231 [Geosiphon pyriformis]|nr:hypothetical protein G9A89_006231 [Geosiphon pyriformis]